MLFIRKCLEADNITEKRKKQEANGGTDGTICQK